MQRTTEKTGERVPDDPAALIDEQRQRQPCSLMVVEVDGTTSPQITEQEGVAGRARLRAPTCYKKCNLVVIEKHSGDKVADGAHHNWELKQTHFPGAIPILDYYHAAQHLADFCKLLPATRCTSHGKRWSTICCGTARCCR